MLGRFDALQAIIAGIAVLGGIGFAAALPALILLPRLALTPFMMTIAYLGVVTLVLCCALLAAGLGAGLALDWPERAKAVMLLGILATPGAFAGALCLLAAAQRGGASVAINRYFSIAGASYSLLFALPAILGLFFWAAGSKS